jgi:hypothetical protein
MTRLTPMPGPFVAVLILVLAGAATIMVDRLSPTHATPSSSPAPLRAIRPQNGVISVDPASSSAQLSRVRAVQLARAYMPNLFARGHLTSVRYGNISYRESPASSEMFADTWVIIVNGVNDTMPSMAMDPSIRVSYPVIHGYAIFVDASGARGIHAIGLF